MARKKTSKRPPKGWMAACLRGVSRAKRAVRRGAARVRRRLRDPNALCGNTWYNVMSDAGRKKAKRKYRN